MLLVGEWFILSAKSTVKYLGVELDQHLSGEYIARNAISNINNKVKFLLRNTIFFNMKVKKNVDNCTDSVSFWVCISFLVFWVV